ncbi:hypothetical protein CI105_02525 [Candidatus Izimaplasma bacterium ZiA1]|uniref:(2Fe-2S)-binding protein n=1 Tax=Candidatus Izimoplasma sp. ZiA1 TaxID=2024899 RepID=UPI000BAA8707|nr:hypothetical protein CI105_02525 [Candidatus Izimaplasma bacterium ZiA1]
MDNTILCECHNVAVGDVKRLIENGIVDFGEIQIITSLATSCPSCREQSLKVFNELLRDVVHVTKVNI